MLSLRVELKTSRLLNGCSNQLSYESLLDARITICSRGLRILTGMMISARSFYAHFVLSILILLDCATTLMKSIL
ncbi:hypothetical protein K1719_037020 [Acacia pycnantha]|nr:hypothetical protein K1719_037020 [Acacia pycnantha]